MISIQELQERMEEALQTIKGMMASNPEPDSESKDSNLSPGRDQTLLSSPSNNGVLATSFKESSYLAGNNLPGGKSILTAPDK